MKYNFLSKRKIQNLLKKHSINFSENETKEQLIVKIKADEDPKKDFKLKKDVEDYVNKLTISQMKESLQILGEKVVNNIDKKTIKNALIYNLKKGNNFQKFISKNKNEISILKRKVNEIDHSKRIKLKTERRNRFRKLLVNRIIKTKTKENNSKTNVEEIKNDQLLIAGVPVDLKYKAIVLFKEGKTIKEISSSLNLSYWSIRKWIKKYIKYGDVQKRLGTTGRKFKIDEKIKEIIKELINSEMEVKEILTILKKEHGVKLGRSTLYRYLNLIGKFKRPKEIPILSLANIKKRFEYCMKMLNKSHKNIIFSDESKIEITRNKRKFFHFKNQKKYKITTASKHISIMVFGAISMRGKVYFKVLERNVDGNYYIEIIDELIKEAD